MKRQIHCTRRTIMIGSLIAFSLPLLWFLQQPLIQFMHWIGNREAVIVAIERLGSWGPIVLFSLLILQVFVPIIPGHALILTGGYVYGFCFGLMINLASTVLASQIAFLAARRFGRAVIYHLAKPEAIQKWERLASHQGILFFFFTFVLPIFPSDTMCFIAGLGTIPAKRFFVANVLGRFVAASFITLIGSNGLHMPSIFWGASLFGVTGLYIGWRIYGRKTGLLKRKPYQAVSEVLQLK